MNYAIITGASKGLGETLARRFLDEGVSVVGISRSINKQLLTYSESTEASFYSYSCDLSAVDELEDTCDQIKTLVFKKDTEKVYLINNAATVNPIDVSANHTREAIEKHVNLNLTAPMFTTSRLLHDAKKYQTKVILANISSGAAQRSTYGWSLYGATKAAINRYTETVALEVDELDEQHKIILFDPSIMDTSMQRDIRSTSKAQFKDVDQFKEYKQENALRSPETVGNVLVDLLLDEQALINGHYYSIHDFV
ncbi:benzil reductase ((S)-benzoin forming) [Halolactibacillus miurensis]|uniref:Benzil reductase ((S)-benzoin forming) n=1 Tax=Halolactibacillus miurensis TaxID=306541 RepID=A0A1I6ULR6_9BACI|nr:SDR family NAD(P)-dependent oxidoreductase [Halolactibacillus sp. JCM 19043]GEM05357.1 benzil reductase ((S)-benzoin forming) [Halolactibacillus miurensis]SFT02361.1 benzil reductase ((S)-benzoin forming) [Halolactibacillus miurensis]